MQRVTRTDTSKLRLDKLPRNGAGAVRFPATVARTGVQKYGTIREYRPDEEVFSAESLASLQSVPVTFGHPPAGVSPSNARDYQRGHVTDQAPEARVKVDGSLEEWIKTHLIVGDAEVLDAIESGAAEVSCGYECDLEMIVGVTPNGEKHDAIQRNIRFNHVAILPSDKRARAGSGARLREDQEPKDPMKVIKIDGVEYEFGSDRHIAKVESDAQKRVDAVTAERDNEKARADKLEAERDTEKARADKAEGENKVDKIDELVAARHSLLSSAAKLLPGDYDTKGKFDAQIRKDACEAVLGEDSMKGKSEAYVEARFDGLVDGQDPSAPAQYHAPAPGTRADSRKVNLDNDDDAFRAHLAKSAGGEKGEE